MKFDTPKRILLLSTLLALQCSFNQVAKAGDTTYTLTHIIDSYVQAPGSDCWGWTAPDGTEYALMSDTFGMVIYMINPLDTIPPVDPIPGLGPILGPTAWARGPSIGQPGWRDYKTYQHYAYAVTEATGQNSGLQVIDLSFLPDSVHHVGSVPIEGSGIAKRSHNLSVDTVTGFMYAEEGLFWDIAIHDLTDPENPTYVGGFGRTSCHDLYADNDTVYVAEGFNGSWAVWDLTDKSNPLLIVRVSIPNGGFVHTVWPSPDRQYCVTTEETAGKTIKIWDISNLANIQLVTQMLGPSRLAHNAIWHGNLIFASHYESGISIWDVSNLTKPKSVGSYDTYPAGNEPNYNGCWGIYPFPQSSRLIASNREGIMNVLQLEAACPPASAPLLLLPGNDDSSVLEPILLTWRDQDRPAYQILLDDDSSFNSPELDSIVSDTAVIIPDLAYDAVYYWKVRAQNSCGLGNWSGSRNFRVGCLISLTGDVDFSGSLTSGDIISLVSYVFKGGQGPLPIEAAGDTNCNGSVGSSDIIALVNHVFKGGPEPCDVCTIL